MGTWGRRAVGPICCVPIGTHTGRWAQRPNPEPSGKDKTGEQCPPECRAQGGLSSSTVTPDQQRFNHPGPLRRGFLTAWGGRGISSSGLSDIFSSLLDCKNTVYNLTGLTKVGALNPPTPFKSQQ